MADEQAVVESVKEGSRWRYAKPSADDVKSWFDTQLLDENMTHDDYLSGVVLIPANEKVKVTKQAANGRKVQEEVYEMTYTPYVRVDMRVLYFRRLAEQRGLVRVIKPKPVPKITDTQSAYFNQHMEEGLWWHVVADDEGKSRRFLVATWRVALYHEEPWTSCGSEQERDALSPVLEGIGSKQVNGGSDPNAIMKAETGAIGRALGVAGILVVGTGIATAEDMQEALSGPQAAATAQIPESGPALPAAGAVAPEAQLTELYKRAVELETQIKGTSSEAWREFAAWWKERSQTEGWRVLSEVPIDPLRGIVSKMERVLDHAQRNPPTEQTTEVGNGAGQRAGDDEQAGTGASTGSGEAQSGAGPPEA